MELSLPWSLRRTKRCLTGECWPTTFCPIIFSPQARSWGAMLCRLLMSLLCFVMNHFLTEFSSGPLINGLMLLGRVPSFSKLVNNTHLRLFCFLFTGNAAGALQTIKKHQILPVSKGFKAVKKTRGADIWKTWKKSQLAVITKCHFILNGAWKSRWHVKPSVLYLDSCNTVWTALNFWIKYILTICWVFFSRKFQHLQYLKKRVH